MTDNPRQMSRRDWFRLRAPYVSKESLGTEPQKSLQPIDEPPNYDGMDLSELPPIHEAMISADDVKALFADIKHCAKDVQLIARGAKQAGPDQSGSLEEIGEALLSGRVKKMQVRYVWQSSRWIDTLEQQPNGFRLVRIAHAS